MANNPVPMAMIARLISAASTMLDKAGIRNTLSVQQLMFRSRSGPELVRSMTLMIIPLRSVQIL
jgi:hypothetical protein